MALKDPWASGSNSYGDQEFRLLTLALAGTDGLSTVGGVLQGLKVSQQASPDATVQVAAGHAIIPATGAGLGGAYLQTNDAALTSPSFTATSSNGRKDRLILRVTAGSPSTVALEIVEGTASASPAEPSITGDNYLELALITLPSSTSNVTDAMITDRRSFIGKWAQPWGEITSDSTNSDTSTTTTTTDTPLSVTFTQVKNRRYRYEIAGHVFSTQLGDTIRVSLTDGSNVVKGTPSVWDHICQGANVANSKTFVGEETAASAASVTRKVRVVRGAGGGGTVHFFADATRAATLRVYDVGPASNPD